MVAVDQVANIGIQFQGKRQSGPAFIILCLPHLPACASSVSIRFCP